MSLPFTAEHADRCGRAIFSMSQLSRRYHNVRSRMPAADVTATRACGRLRADRLRCLIGVSLGRRNPPAARSRRRGIIRQGS
jgi:hypothetical protein